MIFRSQSNDFMLSTKNPKKLRLSPLQPVLLHRTTPKRKPFFVLPFRGCSHDFYSQK
ncbi:hypothetical protein HMPREF9441_03650 [Paraprevotella clara YIT 11840]|uniref:Uncharacterized protein n=1 Tax=Paraprevotella clara YIT 11840 TaxID=762968 RepID=G5SW78_9BACT|nr:hypothetical protein HMPREF9441_03650 [Paraprevotella clara YIT 11840]